MRDRKSMNRTLRKGVGASIVVFLAFLVSTCEISVGLGSKVDVERPVVSIVSPAASSYLQFPLTLNGTASDDISLSSVSVAWAAGDGRTVESGSRAATVSGGNWQLTLTDEDIPEDGSWIFSVTARDNVGKTSTTTVPVTIDNTPPTVMATSPLTYTFETGRERYKPIFYRDIDLKGEVYDSSPLEFVEAYVVGDGGETLLGPRDAGR